MADRLESGALDVDRRAYLSRAWRVAGNRPRRSVRRGRRTGEGQDDCGRAADRGDAGEHGDSVPPARAAACGFSVPSRTASARDSALSVSAVLKALPAPTGRLQAGRHLISAVGMGTELPYRPLHVGPQGDAEVSIRGKGGVVRRRDEALDEASVEIAQITVAGMHGQDLALASTRLRVDRRAAQD